MKYLKRLKKELAKRTKRIDWSVSSSQVNRALALGPLVRLVNAVRDIDRATEEWSKDNALQDNPDAVVDNDYMGLEAWCADLLQQALRDSVEVP